MASPRLVAFLEALDGPMPALQARAEALVLRAPGEGRRAGTVGEEAEVLLHFAEGVIGPVQGWVRAVQQLAAAERAWGPSDNAPAAARTFVAATEEFLAVWERLPEVQPASEPMRHVLGLIHVGFYEFFQSGPAALWHSCRDIAAAKSEARLDFEPSAPSLQQATYELRRLRALA